ncbi:hypothetical protein ACOCEA_09880 [Maribacter sp. CXY002]|uniref:hypothetical protein n=1 Tax=Maribacter luteocoastalis TaxID=3407671 RepID=UPI003B67D134
MGNKRPNILYAWTALVIIVCLLTPYLIKINHGINEHQSVHCVSEGTLHIHNVEFDCDFEHYQLSSLFYPNLFVAEIFTSPKILQETINHYTFLSKYQSLHFVLRGPPTV